MEQADTNKRKKAEEIINNVLNKDSRTTRDPKIFTVRVRRLARNIKFVYADLDGNVIDVLYPRNRENSVGRVIKVEKANDLGENIYRVIQEII